MTIDQDRDYMDETARVEARRETFRVSVIGILVAIVLGVGLVSLLLYGRILVDDASVVTTPPAAITGPVAPAPGNAP